MATCKRVAVDWCPPWPKLSAAMQVVEPPTSLLPKAPASAEGGPKPFYRTLPVPLLQPVQRQIWWPVDDNHGVWLSGLVPEAVAAL